MATIHEQIDELLAADVHHQLSEEERYALHNHLVECASCRQLHQENKIMNKILEETLAGQKPDAFFEQRMLTGFRNRIPEKTSGIAKFLADLIRLRAAQITAVAAVLLALVQVGRMVTGERQSARALAPSIVAEQGEFERDKIASLSGASGDRLAKKSSPAEKSVSERYAGLGSVEGAAPALADAKSEAAAPPPPPPNSPLFHEEETSPQKQANMARPETTTAVEVPAPQLANRKLIRNATVDLEIASFDDAVQKVTIFANEERGYVATTSSEKQENGKLKGEIVIKVVPENLDHFLQRVRGLGELKNQTLGTEDVTKAYFDTDARLKNARVMEQRLIDMLKAKTGKVSDLLQVEKELGRVREEIEKMQGELKYWDSEVQFATVTISLAETDMEKPAAFLLKERVQVSLYAPEVEKIYNEIKVLVSPKIQITNAQLDRDNAGRVSARVSMLLTPEESDGVIGKVKAMGRVENFQTQTERIAQGGNGMSESAKTKRDKVELNITLSRDEQEEALQQTTLRIRSGSVDDKTKELHNLAQKQGGRVRASSFSRDPNGREFADVSLRVPMKNYSAFIQSLHSLGKVEDVSVQRRSRTNAQIDEANAPADISIQVYSQGNIVSQDNGLFTTLRRTLAQSATAIMWSLRMIGVAIAFLAPWAIALVAATWVMRRILRARQR